MVFAPLALGSSQVILPLQDLTLGWSFVVFSLRVDVTEHQDKHQDEVEDEHANRATKTHHVASADALAEKHAVMVVASYADIAVLAVVHVFGHVHVALDAVENFVSSSILVFSDLISWLIVPCLAGFL